LTYPVAGSPELAEEVRGLLAEAGFTSDKDDQRGLDHGVFEPFKLIYPDANVPIVQLSLKENLNAAEHLAIGRALMPLRERGVLIVGSGMSYHNLRGLFTGHGNAEAEAFDVWLNDVLTTSDVDERNQRLAEWEQAPGAWESHPRPEHLLPLMVAVGAAGEDPGRRTYHDHILGKPISGFQFG
jgi:aromatic ring-opening dioxygenase catalytic subunit (LigB family)